MILRIVTIEGTTPKKDKSVSLRFCTMEQTPEQAAELFSLMGKMAVIAIKPDQESFLNEDIGKLDEIEVDLQDQGKTPSKRLRNSLYVLHSQEIGRKPTAEEFKDFYKMRMERMIEFVKNKLD